jgi:hypothetical protein
VISLLLNTCILLGLLLFSYWQYAFVYRCNTEPPAQQDVTNTDAAVNTLKEQMKVLGSKNELVSFAFNGRKSETEYGTYVIPGMKSTRTFLNKKGNARDVCTSMTPQGLAVTENYVIISAYCQTRSHNSVLYILDKESHEFIKEIVLPGRPHVGGLAYDAEHDLLWYASNESGVAQAKSLSMESIRTYDIDQMNMPVTVSQTCSLYGILRASFMTFYDGSLYVGCFDAKNNSVIGRYPVDEEGIMLTELTLGLGTDFEMAIPLDYSTISKQVQGMAFYKDKLLLSHSFGILPSSLVFYVQSDERLYVNENSAKTYQFPERLEQIYVEDDNLYVLFESAAYAYRASSFKIVDRVLKLSLPKMVSYENQS